MPQTPRTVVLSLAVSLFCVSAAFAQTPVIGPPVNAGSYLQAGLPNSGVAQGSMFIIFGSAMADPTKGTIFAGTLPLPTILGKTSVSVTVGGTTLAAILSYVSAGQLAAILPSGTPLGTGTVTVTYNGKTSNTAPILVVSNVFGALTVNQSGTGPGVIFNNSQSGTPVNSLLVSAKPGEVAVIWGTGLGALSSGNDASLPSQIPAFNSITTVVVGGISAQVQYAGRSTFAGIDQINFVVPAGVSGCWVPVYVVMSGNSGSISSNVSTMAVSANGGACTDPIDVSSSDISTIVSGKNNLNVGVMQATHYSINFNLHALGGAVSAFFDQFNAGFGQISVSNLAFSPGFTNQGQPSLGYCIAGQFTFDGSILDSVGSGNINYPFFNNQIGAGSSLTISGAAGSQKITEDAPGSGSYKAQLGGINPDTGKVGPTYFNPGTFTVANVSGESIGAFSATLNVPASISWTNAPNPGATIQRAQPIFVNWTGASSSEYVSIIGTSANTTTNAAVSFYCSAPGTAGTFQVPAAIVSMLPPSGASSGDQVGFLVVQNLPLRTQTSFTAPNMDLGFLAYQEAQAVNVNFQ